MGLREASAVTVSLLPCTVPSIWPQRLKRPLLLLSSPTQALAHARPSSSLSLCPTQTTPPSPPPPPPAPTPRSSTHSFGVHVGFRRDHGSNSFHVAPDRSPVQRGVALREVWGRVGSGRGIGVGGGTSGCTRQLSKASEHGRNKGAGVLRGVGCWVNGALGK